MNKVAGLLTLCVLVAVLRAVVVALVVALMLALLWSFIRQPRETLVLLGTLALMGLANARPLAFIVALGAVGITGVMLRGKVKGRGHTGPNRSPGPPSPHPRLHGDGPR